MALIKNKQLHFNYEIVETLHAGIVLSGFEVKSLRQGNASLKGSYVIMQDTEAYLVHTYIAPYQANNIPASYDPYQKRKLLLQKKEFTYLAKQKKSAGLTVVPLSLYTTPRNKIKVELVLVRGKKKSDKRDTLRKRDDTRSIARTLKNNNS